MDAEKQLPQERNGRLYVPGLKEPLHRDPVRHITASVDSLKVERLFQTDEGKTIPRMFVRGTATLKNCTIGLAGEKETFRELRFVCHPCPPDSPEHEWNVIFGFSKADWEIGNDDEWWIECWISTPVLDEFVATHKAGNANSISFACRSDMWADRHVDFAPVSSKIPWKVREDKYGNGVANGKIDSFSWEIVPKADKQDPKLKPEDTEAYKMGQRFADDLFAELQPTKPEPVRKQGPKWWWWALGLGAVFVWWLPKNI
jgi:hypothetical protein